jgi:hypothetical protein
MLFETTVRGIKLIEFVDWANASFKRVEGQPLPEHGLVALPPIQRDSAWDPKQVVDLWDSVFHGLPLGAFMLQQREAGGQGHRAGIDARNAALPEGWHLLDGQQRLRSLLLGLHGFNLNAGARDARCIWIDLDDQDADRRFKLHLTSASQPFGYDDRGYKLHSKDRSQARHRYEPDGARIMIGNRRAYTHELFENFLRRGREFILSVNEHNVRMPSEGHPDGWPPLPRGIHRTRVEGQALFTVMPLHVLLQAWFGVPQERRETAVQTLIGDDNTLVQQVTEMLSRMGQAEVALINASAIGGVDNLRRLYDRIGAGGTPLSTEDRLFSLYKSIRPDFHNLVLDIYQQAGRVMPPSKIAASAIRIANAGAHQEEGAPTVRGNDIPDIVAFSRAIEGQNGNLINQLDQICPGGETGHGPFAKAFVEMSNAVRHDDQNPLGLPAAVMQSLPPQLIQALVFWKMQRQNNFDQNANHVLRFCLAWLLASWNDDKGSGHCFQMIRENPNLTLHQLFASLAMREDLTRRIIQPGEMSQILVTDPPTIHLRSIEDRINGQPPRVADLVRLWWRGALRFLPWLQRDYLAAAFPDYDPLADREDDTPFDVDHMVPQNDWKFSWDTREQRLAPIMRFDAAQLNKLRWARSDLGNAIGNKWLVDLSANRGWGDLSFPGKLQWIQDRVNNDVHEYACLLQGAFECNDQVYAVWQTASNGPVWSDARLTAFQTAVEKRTAWLYETLYNDLELDDWLADLPST